MEKRNVIEEGRTPNMEKLAGAELDAIDVAADLFVYPPVGAKDVDKYADDKRTRSE